MSIQDGVASIWPSTADKVCQTPFTCIKWTLHVYEVNRRFQSQPNSVVGSQMWNTAWPWPWPWSYRLGLHPYDHPGSRFIWQTLLICIEWMFYEYQEGGRSQSYHTMGMPSVRPAVGSPLLTWRTQWEYILMTVNYFRRCRNTSYTHNMEVQSTLKRSPTSTMS